MPLYEEFKYRLPVKLGLTCPPLADQVAEQGMLLPDAELWEQRHRAWNLLFVGGFLTDAEAERIGHRIITRVGAAACFQQELGDSILQVLSVLENQRIEVSSQITNDGEPGAPDEIKPDAEPPETPVPPSALDDYLSNRQAS